MNATSTLYKSTGETAARSRGGALAAVGLALFMAAGLLVNLYSVAFDDLELVPPNTTLEQALDGTASKDIAANLAKTPLPSEMAKWQRGLNWLVAHDLGPKVREGCPGWLFLADELAVHPGRAEHAAARLRTVADIQRKLARAGVKLVVAVVPDKSRVMAKQLCALERPAVLDARARDWVRGLQQAGVSAVDLAPVLQQSAQETYLRTDTHWNERGAQLAAQAVGEAVLSQAGEPLTPRQQTEILPQPPQIRPGDLVRLAGVDWLPAALQPARETASQSEFRVEAIGGESGADDQDDLFGDAGLPTVALMGTSFSRTSGFADFLAHALETPVASFAKDGGGFSGSASEYIASKAFSQTPPKIVVWEIPERDLEAPLKNDKEIWP